MKEVQGLVALLRDRRVTMLYNFAQLYTIFVYAVPFDITLSHFTQRYTICVYAVPFDNTLSHFTQRYTVCMYAIPFYITLSYFTQRYTVCAYAVLLDNLCHLTQRNTVCVLYCKGVLSYSQLSQSISQFHVPTQHGQLDRLSFGWTIHVFGVFCFTKEN